MNVMKSVEKLAYLITDKNNILIDVSESFLEYFSVKRQEIEGISVYQIIQASNVRKQAVFCGIINGLACLIKKTENEFDYEYKILLRQGEVDASQLLAFMNASNSGSLKKYSSFQSRYSFDEIFGESMAMKQIKELAARIATSNSTVLLTGESGTGKELFAQAIHNLSTRKNNPFVAVNCAAIPDELFESEVFGYEAGAFSGAKKEGKPGKIELAQSGTLFLDEISELPYQMQGKLLRVLQEREVERIGGIENKTVDIRIIAATNRNLKMMIQEGKFRQDLFYRLFVFELKIPSLRERKEDIVPLVEYFISYFNEMLGTQVKGIDSSLKEWLLQYDWPGNVRELKAFIERGMNIAQGELLTIHPFDEISNNIDIHHQEERTLPLLSLEEEVELAERKAIIRALQECNNNRQLAANKLNIHLASLYRKIAKYQLK